MFVGARVVAVTLARHWRVRHPMSSPIHTAFTANSPQRFTMPSQPTSSEALPPMKTTFAAALQQQRWDDHRYYHHSRINQSLHLVSALSFIAAYGLLFVEPAAAAWLAWCVSMWTRQAGHFFFEPKGYDHVNQATHEHKEEIKVGYNLRRKVVLMAAWAAVPVLLWIAPSLGGLIEPATTLDGWARDVGLAWLALGVVGLVFRVLQLFAQQGVQTGLVWAAKILTDPFHDAWLYRSAPLHLLRGELIDPMGHVKH
jgi:hypothetical protein